MTELSERERISLLMMRRWCDQQRGYKQTMRLHFFRIPCLYN